MTVRLSRRGFLGVTVSSGLALSLGGVSLARAGELVAPAAGAGSGALAAGSAAGAEAAAVAPPAGVPRVRDHRANESAPMDPVLFDQLATLAATAGVAPHYEIISGYRSPTTNARLAEAGRGVAKRSLHMEGRAIDVRLRGVPCDALRDLALGAARGGVGYYQKSDFVHLDTGRVRTWAG